MVKELQPGDPQTIGPYRLVGQLGSGGMGRVFLGVSAGGRPVAVKVVRDELAADPQFRMRFGREVAAARRVSGVFTAMVVDADVDGPTAWLATAYVPGPSLTEAINDHGPLPASSLLTLAAGLAESLSAIHAAGVVHRDLKPSNVLIAEDGPRVIDFGISRAAESTALTQTGLVIGSPGFMSPEQAMGYEVGQPSDIFSLGAVLAFAATGEGPFGAGTTAALLYRVVHGSPSLDQVPAEVRPLIERCLAKDPSQRPTAAGLLAEVGALQPTANWLPESIIRAFAGDSAPDPGGGAAAGFGAEPASARSRLRRGAGFGAGAAVGAVLEFGEAATRTTAARADARESSGESQLLAPAGTSQAAASGSMPPPPGNTYPPGDAYRQPPPAGRDRPRRRVRRPIALAFVGGVIVASAAAGFAVTALTGHTPAPAQSPAGLTSSAPGSTSGGRGARRVSASSSASRSASSRRAHHRHRSRAHLNRRPYLNRRARLHPRPQAPTRPRPPARPHLRRRARPHPPRRARPRARRRPLPHLRRRLRPHPPRRPRPHLRRRLRPHLRRRLRPHPRRRALPRPRRRPLLRSSRRVPA